MIDAEWHLQRAWEAATDELHRLLDLHAKYPSFDPREVEVARADVRAARQALDQFDLTNNRRNQP